MTTPQFYLVQTTFSDPGEYAYLYDALPDDLVGLCRTVRGIYRHYMDVPNPTPDRLPEVDLRYVSGILDRAVALDGRPLTEKRAFDKRVVGCCRDAALLLVSMLRHKAYRHGCASASRPISASPARRRSTSITSSLKSGMCSANGGFWSIPNRGRN